MNKHDFFMAINEFTSCNSFTQVGDVMYYTDDLLKEFESLTLLNGRETLRDILKRKSADYSGDNPFDNFERCEREIGIATTTGMKIRMLDKISRIENLRKKPPEVINESLADSLLDLAGYIVLFNIYDKYIRNGYLH